MSSLRVTVVGAGVIGLTCAVALQEAGHDVHVVAAGGPTTSEVAGGLWLPYATADDPRVLCWAVETAARLEADGHRLVDYLHLERATPFWLSALAPERVREAGPQELPPAPAWRRAGWRAATRRCAPRADRSSWSTRRPARRACATRTS